jgi:hypothetical protein
MEDLKMDKVDWEAFCRELTELCNKHRIGIEGGTPFIMENDDFDAVYTIDEAGNLTR